MESPLPWRTAHELLAAGSGLLSVWLSSRLSIWNFPVGMLHSLLLALLLWQQRLFADAGLQLLFVVLAAAGWWRWSQHGWQDQRLPVRLGSLQQQGLLLALCVGVSGLLVELLTLVRGSAPLADALLTSVSLCAQWQLNQRQLQHWYWWLAADAVAVPLYWSRDLPWLSLLYLLYAGLCLRGWWLWRRQLHRA